jgi:hypothetical protein
MRQCCMTQCALAATRLTLTSQHHGDLEIQIQSFYGFEWRKVLNSGAVGRGVRLHHERRFSANQRGGDDAIVVFEVSGSGVFRRGTRYN